MFRKLIKTLKKKSNAKKRSSAFTIIETVVASSLLAIAFVPILRGLTSVHRTTRLIEEKTRSLVFAQAKLDEIKSRSIYNYSTNFNESSISLDGSYLCNVTDDQDASLRTITVLVGYDENGSATLTSGEVSITLKTCLAKRW